MYKHPLTAWQCPLWLPWQMLVVPLPINCQILYVLLPVADNEKLSRCETHTDTDRDMCACKCKQSITQMYCCMYSYRYISPHLSYQALYTFTVTFEVTSFWTLHKVTLDEEPFVLPVTFYALATTLHCMVQYDTSESLLLDGENTGLPSRSCHGTTIVAIYGLLFPFGFWDYVCVDSGHKTVW